MSAPAKAPKPLSATARKRAIAQQTLWAVVSRYTGRIFGTFGSRGEARYAQGLYGPLYCVERINVRVLGVRP